MEGTSKNRIISPGKVLHFYNSPPDSTMESLNEVFGKVGVSPPNGVKFFSQGTSLTRISGLVTLIVNNPSLAPFPRQWKQECYRVNGVE